MTIAFKDEKLKRWFSTKEAMVKAFGLKAKQVSLRLDEIEDADNLKILQRLPALNCRQLTNNPLGQWALNVSSNYTMIFSLDHNPIPLNEDGTVNTELITKICIIGLI